MVLEKTPRRSGTRERAEWTNLTSAKAPEWLVEGWVAGDFIHPLYNQLNFVHLSVCFIPSLFSTKSIATAHRNCQIHNNNILLIWICNYKTTPNISVDKPYVTWYKNLMCTLTHFFFICWYFSESLVSELLKEN